MMIMRMMKIFNNKKRTIENKITSKNILKKTLLHNCTDFLNILLIVIKANNSNKGIKL